MTSKPNLSTFFSIVLFLLIDTGIIIYLVSSNLYLENKPTYVYILTPVLLIIALFIIFKIVNNYKVVTVRKNQIRIKHPLLFTSRKHAFTDISSWQETIIKTNKTLFKELLINFDRGRKLKLSYHENSNYNGFLQLLKKKVKDKMITESHN